MKIDMRMKVIWNAYEGCMICVIAYEGYVWFAYEGMYEGYRVTFKIKSAGDS